MTRFPILLQATPDVPDNVKVPVSQTMQTLQELVDGFYAVLPYIVIGIIVIILFMIIARLARGLTVHLGHKTALDPSLAQILGGISSFLIVLLGLLIAAVIVFPGFKPANLLTGLGITTVALGFAAKDILQNFLAGIFILWRKPFVVGDQIKTLGYEGTIIGINIRSSRLKTYNGELVVIPNGDIYTSPILVYTTYDFRRIHLKVGIGYKDDIEEARGIIHRILSDNVLKDPPPEVLVTDLAPDAVVFTIYFWAEPWKTTEIQMVDLVATKLKYAFDEAGIDIPYPQRVIHYASDAREDFRQG